MQISKGLILILSMTMVWNSNSQAGELKPLRSILAEETSSVMSIYVGQRCASLFAIVSVAMKRNPNMDAATAEKFREAGENMFLATSVTLIEQEGITKDAALGRIQSNFEAFSSLYVEEMNEHYIRTGNLLTENAEDDLEICASLAP